MNAKFYYLENQAQKEEEEEEEEEEDWATSDSEVLKREMSLCQQILYDNFTQWLTKISSKLLQLYR